MRYSIFIEFMGKSLPGKAEAHPSPEFLQTGALCMQYTEMLSFVSCTGILGDIQICWDTNRGSGDSVCGSQTEARRFGVPVCQETNRGIEGGIH